MVQCNLIGWAGAPVLIAGNAGLESHNFTPGTDGLAVFRLTETVSGEASQMLRAMEAYANGKAPRPVNDPELELAFRIAKHLKVAMADGHITLSDLVPIAQELGSAEGLEVVSDTFNLDSVLKDSASWIARRLNWAAKR